MHVWPILLGLLQSSQPNILFVHVDDWGWQDTAVPMHVDTTPLNERYRTPNMERLAATGTVLTNHHAAALSHADPHQPDDRSAPARTHITYWTPQKDTDTSRRHPTVAASPGT